MSKHILRKHVHGFTSVSNNVIKVLKGDLESLGFYLYLLSLPDNWEFYKTQLAKDCSIGIKKLEKILKKLGSFSLVQYGQKRNEHGQFMNFYMDIYDTETLKINELDKEAHVEPPEGHFCRTAKAAGRFGEAIQEELTKEELNTTKDKSLCSSTDELPFFDQFWFHYRRRQKKQEARHLWKKLKLEEKGKYIVDHIIHRNNTEWYALDTKYIPLPSTFLRNSRFDDEIIIKAPKNKKEGLTVTEAINLCLN